LGVKYVCGAPAYSSTVNEKTPVPMLVRFAQEFVPAFYHAQGNGQLYQTRLMVNFDEEVDSYCRACSTPVCPQLTSDGLRLGLLWTEIFDRRSRRFGLRQVG